MKVYHLLSSSFLNYGRLEETKDLDVAGMKKKEEKEVFRVQITYPWKKTCLESDFYFQVHGHLSLREDFGSGISLFGVEEFFTSNLDLFFFLRTRFGAPPLSWHKVETYLW